LALPVQWYVIHTVFLYINALGIVLQLWALFLFLKLIKQPYKTMLANQPFLVNLMYGFALCCFIIKLVLQAATLFPAFAATLINHLNFIIGFIHLSMLGVISGFLFSFILKTKMV